MVILLRAFLLIVLVMIGPLSALAQGFKADITLSPVEIRIGETHTIILSDIHKLPPKSTFAQIEKPFPLNGDPGVQVSKGTVTYTPYPNFAGVDIF